jgi:K+-sensing histidine kinase KdpD
MTALLGLIPHLASENSEKREKILELAEQEALHLDFHIQNLVAAAEIENGEIKMSYSLIYPEELIDEVLKG